MELAGRLAALELTSELDTFHRAAVTYANVLGAEGIAAYRKIVEPKWKTSRKAKDPYSHSAFRAREAMIGIAQAGGDPDDLIAIRGDDLRSPDAYLEIAGELAAAGRNAEALDWARRGLATFADRHWQTPPLRHFLAAQLRALGDGAAAEELWWEAFERVPSLDGYRKLLAESSDAGARRAEAIGLLRARLDAGDSEERTRNPLLDGGPATTLVEVLLYEGDIDDAWDAASAYGCDERTWMTLARGSRGDSSPRRHPDLRASRRRPDRHQQEQRVPGRGRSPRPHPHAGRQGGRTQAVHRTTRSRHRRARAQAQPDGAHRHEALDLRRDA